MSEAATADQRLEYLAECLEGGQLFLPSFVADIEAFFCGCGDPEAAWGWIHGYLERMRAEVPVRPDSGAEYIAVYLLDHLDYTEHGSSVRCAWPTDKGLLALAFLDRWGSDWGAHGRMWVDIEGVSHGDFS